MDCSVEYIKMCRKAVEIQDELPRNEDENGRKYVDGSAYTIKYDIETKRLIWLPRQDQLQGMGREDTDYYTLMKFDTWVFNLARVYDDIIIEKFSMEQLWLAFVMWELHSKKWDGSDWIMSQDRRIKERRSFPGGTYSNYIFLGERRKTIIVAGRRDKERRVSQDQGALNKPKNICFGRFEPVRGPSFWRKAWLDKPEIPGIK